VKRFWLLFVVMLAVLLIFPFESLQAPLWEVSVVDQANRPIGGVTVREGYQHYSAQFSGGETDLTTDNQGRVTFPAKTFRANLLKRFAVMASSAAGGVHASFGPHAYVFAFGNGVEGNSVKNGYVEDWTGAPKANKSVIVIHLISSPGK
jgi:hypothetical protein